MKKESIVIGAGIVGVSIAWHLQRKGYQVTLIDAKAPGEETSYGNAGLIQREAIYPHSFPIKIQEILRILPNKSNDIRYHLRALAYYAKPLLKYWKNSQQKNYEKIVSEWKTLITHSTNEHEIMLKASSSEYLVRKEGWIQLFRSSKNLESTLQNESELKTSGVELERLTPMEIQLLEPSLNVENFVGGIHWLNAWQVKNPSKLVKAYAENFQSLGGIIIQEKVVSVKDNDGIWAVMTTGAASCPQKVTGGTEDCVKNEREIFRTKNLVVAAGPWSADMLRPLGYDIPLFPIRGYHKHYHLTDGARLNHSIVDNENGFVLSPQEQGIRLTTGAEFTLKESPICLAQLKLDEVTSREIIALGAPIEHTPWFGHRPCLPDMKPIIGPAYNLTSENDKPSIRKGLWFAFGHAHQGFTLGPITGRLLAEMIAGEEPCIDPLPFSSNRFN